MLADRVHEQNFFRPEFCRVRRSAIRARHARELKLFDVAEQVCGGFVRDRELNAAPLWAERKIPPGDSNQRATNKIECCGNSDQGRRAKYWKRFWRHHTAGKRVNADGGEHGESLNGSGRSGQRARQSASMAGVAIAGGVIGPAIDTSVIFELSPPSRPGKSMLLSANS